MNIIGIDKYASVKFSLISFFAMCAVVSWHIGVEGGWVKRYFCPTFCVWSVPWFFYASGVFFVYSIKRSTCRNFIISKFKSLLIPYIFWCGLGGLFMLMMGNCLDFNWCDVFALNRLHPIGNGPLWYIKTLIIFFALSIAAWLLSRNIIIGWVAWALFSFLFISFFVIVKFSTNIQFGPNSSVFYFLAGILTSGFVRRFPMVKGVRTKDSILWGGVLLLSALFVRCIWFVLGYDFYKMGGTFVANLSVILFIVGVLILFDATIVIERLNHLFGRYTKYNTFVYVSHQLVLWRIVSLINRLKLSPDLVYVILSIGAPFLFMCIGYALRIIFPRFYYAVIGQRE